MDRYKWRNTQNRGRPLRPEPVRRQEGVLLHVASRATILTNSRFLTLWVELPKHTAEIARWELLLCGREVAGERR